MRLSEKAVCPIRSTPPSHELGTTQFYCDLLGLKFSHSPLDYALMLRMHIAARDLRQQRKPVAAISQALGYSFESAFGSAFERVFGCAPT